MAGVFTRWTSANHHSKKIVWFFFVYASSTYMNFGEIWNKASLTFYILTTLFHYHHLFLCCSFWCCVFVCVSVCFQQQNILIKNKVDVVSRSFISFYFISFWIFVRSNMVYEHVKISYSALWFFVYYIPCMPDMLCVCESVCILCVDALSPFVSFFLSFIHSIEHIQTHTHKEMYTRTHVRIKFRNINILTHRHGRTHTNTNPNTSTALYIWYVL